MLKDNPTVTFTADYFVLHVVAPLNLDVDVEVADHVAINAANEMIRELYGFSPARFAFDVIVNWDK